MNILHFLSVNWNGIGGLQHSVPALVRAQNRIGDGRAALVMTRNNSVEAPEFDFPVFDLVEVFPDRRWIGLPAPFDKPDLAILHSTYIPAHARIAQWLTRLEIPYIICPRGGMTRLAQNNKWLKKKLGNLIFFNKTVARAVALHHLTELEAENSKEWGKPTIVVGNGVELPPASGMANPGQSKQRRMIVLGRLEVWIKGLDVLLAGCEILKSELLRRNATLEIFGPDWRGSKELLADIIRRYGLQKTVTLGGVVKGDAKAKVLRDADAFVQTSRSEGHPVAVLEALSHGVPCLLTPGTNMADEVSTAGAGWRVELSPESIAEGICRILNAEPRELQEAGARARQLAAEQYAWDKIARRTVDAYRKYAA